jgi:hypothetical protein
MFRQSVNGAGAAEAAVTVEAGKLDMAEAPNKEPKAVSACRREKRVVMKKIVGLVVSQKGPVAVR